MTTDPRTRAFSSLKGSGFPFQTAIQRVFQASKTWRVLAADFPWQHPSGESKFIDIVAFKRDAMGSVAVAAVEAKRMTEETFVFLEPKGLHIGPAGRFEDVREHGRFRCLHTCPQVGSDVRDVYIRPESPRAEFCVTSKDPKDGRLLEADVRLLTQSTDVLMNHVAGRRPVGSWARSSEPCLLVPVFVTNAPLFAVSYDTAGIPLDTGLPPVEARDLREIPWIRFQKAFGAAKAFDDVRPFIVVQFIE